MYHHSFLFVIVSDSDRIENALKKLKPLEDCDYTFRTVSSIQDAAAIPQKPDMAFLYDSVNKEEAPTENAACEERILIVKNGSPLLTDKRVLSYINETWVMPKQEGYDEELLTISLDRLARRMKQQADSRKQGICFETLIDSVPDIAWFKDVTGAHLIVNDSFCEVVGKTKEQIYKKGHCYIWNASREDEAVCLSSDKIIMESRTTNTFEENIKTRTDQRMLRSYKSALIDTDGNIFGTCGIAHDMTELRNMSAELGIVLNSIPFAVLIEDMQDIVLNKNAQFDKYFPDFSDLVGKSSTEWKQSLTKKLFLEDIHKEVLIQSEEPPRVLVFEEVPILDIFQKNIGKIITLTDITLERSIAQKNEHTANTDYLTGLNNRRNLMNYLENLENLDEKIFLMLDLDYFKEVNDNFGHDAGDRALIKTADILGECFPNEFIARMGGDEFMIVAGKTNMATIQRDVQRLHDMLSNAYERRKEFKGINASIGIVSASDVPKQERTVSGLLQIADTLLYKAKKGGKGRYCIYGSDTTIPF